MNAMDISQISELAAIMDSWAPASGSQIITNSQALGVQSQEPINKTLVNVVKQEDASVSREYNFPGIVPISAALQGYVPGHIVNQTSPEQVPMDDFDPLEAFTFWDGENFYCHQDFEACAAANACEMQTDSTMPPLPEYIAEDDITRDDVFPIKDPDFLHNPTLAELNSCGENLFDYSVEHNFLTEDNSFPLLADGLSKTFPSSDSHFIASPVSSSIANSSFVSGMNYAPSGFIDVKPNIQHALSSSCPIPSRLMPNSQYFGAGEEKFLMCPQNSPASDSFYMQKLDPIESKSQLSVNSCSVTPPVHATPSRLQESNLLSSSAPPDVTMTSFFPKVKTEPPSHSPGPKSITERSLSGFSSLSLSNDDESGSFFDDDTDHDDDDDFSSDEDVYQYESDEILSTSWPSGKDEKSCQHRKHRYFWQYNLQSRGAKTQNILPRKDSNDPYVLNDAFDPVFSEECALPVKHSGKARRGDGNDLTPNPCKLFNIGIELKKLNKLIYNTHPHESGSQGKPLSRKEKNKLASRVCRLKKKAQHEANKIKLYGLQQEHKKLLTILMDTRELLRYKIENPHDRKLSNCSKKLESFLAANEPYKVAGNTAAFVNEVLDKVAKGECDGGLGQL